ncbi:hypothetical protein BH11PLA2_BH11PLA2_03460 [soil metagenome]
MASRLNKFKSFTRLLFGNQSPVRLYDPTKGSFGKQFVQLEDRAVPATFVVTNILDNNADVVGGLSLRQAILAANGNPGFDRIEFNIPRSTSLPTIPNDTTESYFPIVLASTLPDLTDVAGVSIDATTQPRNNVTGTRPIVQLLPDPNPGAFFGQKGAILISGPNNVLRGFVITGFPGSGINITGPAATNNTIIGNWINTDITGTRAWNEDPIIASARPPGTPVELTNTGPNANKFPLFVLGGITLTNGANHNTIGGIIDIAAAPLADAGGRVIGTGDVLKRYNAAGVLTNVIDPATGQPIPVDPEFNRNIISGTPQFKKSYFDYTINGGTQTRRDDIAGSGVGPGIRLMDPGTNNNLIQGNFIGTDVTGNVAIPNHNGIEIFNAASSNYIGNPTTAFIGDPVEAGIGNLIRFNENDGIRSAAIPNPSMISPPIPPGPPPPYIEGEDSTTVTPPGPFGPARANQLAKAAFLDEYNPNYYQSASPVSPNIFQVERVIREYDHTDKTTAIPIESFDPNEGAGTTEHGIEAQVGEKIQIRGTGLLSTTAVTFNASSVSTAAPQTVTAKFTVIDDGHIEVTIPFGAKTPPVPTGGNPDINAINIFTPAGVANILNMNILPSPPTQIEVVSTFSPSSGLSGSIVSVFGTNFIGTQTVSIGGVLAPNFTVDPTGNRIDIVVPTGAQSGPITIITPGGSATSTRDFRVEAQPPPLVTTVSSATAIPGQEVTLTGAYFTGAYLIRFNYAGGSSGFSTTSFIVDSPTQIRVKVPALATASTGPIQVVTNDGFGVSTSTLQILTPPAPTLSSLSISSGVIGAFVTITGTNFTAATRVQFAAADAQFKIINATTIQAVVPFGLQPTVSYPVKVVSAGGSSATQSFTVTASPAATVNSIPFGIRNTFTVVNGTNLFGTTKVLFGHPVTGTPATSFEVLSNTQIRVQIPPAVATNGNFYVYTAYNTQNPLAAPAQNTYTVQDTTFPTIGTGRQSDAISGIIGDVVTLRGTGFTGTQQVLFPTAGGGTVPANNLNIVSDFEINFTVPLQAVSGPITVDSPGVPDTNLPFTPADPPYITTIPFTVKASPFPTVVGSFPTSGPIGTILTISGTGFIGTVQVTVGGGVADKFTVVSDNLIRITVPLLAQSGLVRIQTPGGTATVAGAFTLTDSPVPTLNYSTPRAARNTQVTISGAGLAGTTKVLFNDQPAAFTVFNDTLITAIVPLSAGPGEIRIFTPGGNVASPTAFDLANIAPPTIEPVGGFADIENADAAPVGSHISINGINLNGNFAVGFQNIATGKTTRAPFDFVTRIGTSILTTVPEVDPGQYRINVYSSITDGGDPWNWPTPTSPITGTNYDFSYSEAVNILGTTFTYGELFTVLPNARPIVEAVTNNDGGTTFERGVPIAIRGTGFTGANRITINGVDIVNDPATTRFRVLSDNLILSTVPLSGTKADGTPALDGTAAVTDCLVQVFTPNGVAGDTTDDLGSIQTGEEAQIDLTDTLPFTFTVQNGGFFGSNRTITATSGNFYALLASSVDAFDHNGNPPGTATLGTGLSSHTQTPLRNPTTFRTYSNGPIDYTGFAHETSDHDAIQSIRSSVAYTLVAGSGGTMATVTTPTGFAKIPDAVIVVPPNSPPAPLPPPGADVYWTLTSIAGTVADTNTKVLVNRPPAPTVTSTSFTGFFNRVITITGNAGLISTQGVVVEAVDANGNDASYAIDRNEIQVAGTGPVTLRFVLKATNGNFGTGAFPTGRITVFTPDGTANSTFTVTAQPVPQIFAFITTADPPQDNRFLANRVFDNGLTIQRDPTTTYITGVTPKSQATKFTDGNLGIDFVTINPNAAPGFPFDYGYARIDQGPPNAPPAGNQGRGGLNDGQLDSFSLPSGVSALPTDPNFNNIALPTGIAFGTGLNTFNNTQYGRYFGPNLNQNFPLLQVVSSSVDRTEFSTALLAKPYRSYRIDYYYNPGIDNGITDANLDPFLYNQSPANFIGTRFDDQDITARKTTNIGSGQIYLGSKVITTNGTGDGSVSFNVYKRLPTDPNDPTSIPPLAPGEFQLPNNLPLVATITDPVTGAITFRSGVVTSTATDLTAPGPLGPILTAGPDGTSRMSFFKRVDTPTGSISGKVIIDKNANGIIDAAEQGLDKGIVSLYVQKDDGTYFSTPTSQVQITGEGSYFFGANGTGGTYGLPLGKHKLVLTLPTGGSTTYFYESPIDGMRSATIISGEAVSGQDFLVTTTPIVTNTPPTISNIANQSVLAGATVGPLNFTVGDAETPAAALTVTATSSNTSVVIPGNITFGGSGTNRTITVPTTGVNGNTTITVTVTDSGGLTSTDTFVISSGVPPVNTPPSISNIADETTMANATFVKPFVIGDAETLADNLQVSVTTSNGTVVPPGNITLSGTGSDRTISITMPPAVQGSSTITVSVTDDGGLTASDTFVVTIPPPPGTAPRLVVVGSDAGRKGQVNVYNPDGTFRYTLTPYGDDFTGGVRVATGDVNDDGNADIITAPGIGFAGLVKVYSGVTGEFITQFLPYGDVFKGGVYVVTGDVDGDGVLDIVTGTGVGGGPRVRVYRGGSVGGVMNLENLADFFAYENKFRQGVIVAAGDVNNDGKADIVTSTGKGAGPRVRVLDGTRINSLNGSDANAGAATLFDFFAYDNRFRGGVFATVGDVDGDGLQDIITGTGVGGGSAVKVFRQSDLAGNVSQPVATKSFFAYDPAFLGGVRVDVTDGNNDGITDIVTGPGTGLPADVRVINYATLQDIYRIQAFEASFNGGVFIGGNVQ